MPRIAPQPSLRRWIYAFAWWTGIVLVYSTLSDAHGHPLSPEEALKASAARWYVWAALSYFIIAIDKRLPIRHESLWKRFLIHLPISVCFIALYTFLNYWTCVFIGAPLDLAISTADGPGTVLARALTRPSNLVYWVIVVTHVVLNYERQKKDQEIRTARLERLVADARLTALRSQLHPHFLFNSLNAISAYIDTSPRAAKLMLEQLGDLLRMSLEHYQAREIPIEQELAFLEKYLELQQMRFEDRLESRIQMDPGAAGALVPTFILQPLVENAVRHGVAARHERSVIEVKARRVDGNLGLSVRDDGPGLPSGWSMVSSAGVGLANTRARLDALYGPGHHTLNVTNAPGGGVLVNLVLPFHVGHAETASA
jgi:two-component system LytT family sensor kinase